MHTQILRHARAHADARFLQRSGAILIGTIDEAALKIER